MKRTKRVIDVFEGKLVMVQVEGGSISVQLVDPVAKTVQYKFIVPTAIAAELVVVLTAALTLPGEVVNETAMAVVAGNSD